mmetsp:Transcript_49775/g.142924  ORF Transcript_49775/g.142924 Transcript_49775/m.142924 type:complete len:244 (-) Transcript_49775:858-1589(-)
MAIHKSDTFASLWTLRRPTVKSLLILRAPRVAAAWLRDRRLPCPLSTGSHNAEGTCSVCKISTSQGWTSKGSGSRTCSASPKCRAYIGKAPPVTTSRMVWPASKHFAVAAKVSSTSARNGPSSPPGPRAAKSPWLRARVAGARWRSTASQTLKDSPEGWTSESRAKMSKYGRDARIVRRSLVQPTTVTPAPSGSESKHATSSRASRAACGRSPASMGEKTLPPSAGVGAKGSYLNRLCCWDAG